MNKKKISKVDCQTDSDEDKFKDQSNADVLEAWDKEKERSIYLSRS